MPSREELIERGKKTQFKSGKQAAKSGKAGGIASGVAKREKRLMREILDELLSRKAGKSEMTYKEAIMLRTVKQAIDGNAKAREFIRDTIGEKPTDKQEITGSLGVKKVFVTKEEQAEVEEHIADVIGDGR